MLSSIILELGREGADLAVRMEAFQILINSCKYVFSPILHCLRILQRTMLVHCDLITLVSRFLRLSSYATSPLDYFRVDDPIHSLPLISIVFRYLGCKTSNN